MPRGFVDNWRPQQKTRELLGQVLEILSEYRAQLPLTLRQIFYRLVARYDYEKSERSYDKLSAILTMARRARWEANESMSLWEAMRDDSLIIDVPFAYHGENDFWAETSYRARNFRLDRMINQRRRIALWCEAVGMKPQLARIAAPYGIGVYTSQGTDKINGKHDTARQFIELVDEQGEYQPITILHIGDHDPSGVHIFETLADDVIIFALQIADEKSERLEQPDIEFIRLAITPEQANQHYLPTSVRNADDRRRFDRFVTRHHSLGIPEYLPCNPGIAWQAEALDPATLAQIVQEAIATRVDVEVFAQIRAQEEEVRQLVMEKLDRLSRIQIIRRPD
jgi:hypothetical protein